MDDNLRNWAKSIGYVPVNNTDDEIAEFLRTQKYYVYCLTRSAVVNEKFDTLEWLEKYNLLVPNDVVISAAAEKVMPMIKHCIDKGYNTSECCSIAFLNNHFEFLTWLKDNNCQCDKSQYYHGYQGNLLQILIRKLSNKTEYEDLKRLYVSGFTEFPKDLLIHHIGHGYPRDREWLLTHCSILQIDDSIKDLVKEDKNMNNIIKLRLADRKVRYMNDNGNLVIII